MPELPDVEHFKDIFEAHGVGKNIQKTRVIKHRERKTVVLRDASAADLSRAAVGERFVSVGRVGKFLIASLSNGYTVVFHFRLSGALVPTGAGEALDEACRGYSSLAFDFADGSGLWFVDRRNLGHIYLTQGRRFERIGVLAKMGVDPLTRQFTLERFRKIVEVSGDLMVKKMLTDQKRISGIGNEYSDFIDYLAGVRPTRRVGSLSEDEVNRIHAAIPRALRLGIGHYHGRADGFEFMEERHKGGHCPRHPDVPLAAVRWGASHAYFCPVEQH